MDELLDLKQRLEQERPTPWAELPDLALYMDQIISYMPRQLIHFDDGEVLTSAMVNNYIKDGLVPRADGKRYGPIHLGYLTAVCALKRVLSVRDMRVLLLAAGGRSGRSRRRSCTSYFRQALDRALDETARAPGRPGRRGGPAPPGPGPGPAQLRRPAGLRPDPGHSPAPGAEAQPKRRKNDPDAPPGPTIQFNIRRSI